ncbi:hypothetical protein BHE74_00027529 [Ensete ventricosum]|nr:hypothetical protein BHE74_00027529 [Ensete ventricosum]
MMHPLRFPNTERMGDGGRRMRSEQGIVSPRQTVAENVLAATGEGKEEEPSIEESMTSTKSLWAVALTGALGRENRVTEAVGGTVLMAEISGSGDESKPPNRCRSHRLLHMG